MIRERSRASRNRPELNGVIDSDDGVQVLTLLTTDE